MPFRRRARSNTRSRRGPARRFVSRRTTRSRVRRVASKPQEIRIVIEQPSPGPTGIPSSLPPGVGLVAATTPRRNRF